MSLKGITYIPGVLFILLLLSVAGASCNNSDKSENNSTTVDYNLRDTNSNTATDTSSISGINTTDTTNKISSGRTTTGGKRKGRITVMPSPNPGKSAVMATDKQGYYNYTETPASFNGGQSALETFINNNIVYPDDAINNEVEGTVYVQFAIDENGKVSNAVTTGNKIGSGLEEAALDAVSKMPAWTPGKVKGKNVKVKYTLPITFKLEDR
jgi:TonB family protein